MFNKQLSSFRQPASIGGAAAAQTSKGKLWDEWLDAYSQTHTQLPLVLDILNALQQHEHTVRALITITAFIFHNFYQSGE